MADNVEKLSLDASGYLKEVDKIIKIMDRANAQAEKFNALMGHLETEIDNNTASITRRNLAGDILTTRLKQEDGAWKIVAQSVRDHTVVTQKQAYAIKELDDAMRKVRESRAADAAHGITGREGEIALQIALDKEVEYQKRSEREFDRHVDSILKKQRELYRKLVEEATKANQKSSNERNSGLVTNQLSKQFITPSIATPAEVQKLEANIGRISSLVAQGTVSATRALQIVNSVSKNTGEIFTGTELRVANATRSMIKSSQDLGSNYRKEVTSMAAANEQSVTRILLGWREMARLITIRALTNLFHAFINELRTTIVTATEFARHIGEIQTISQDAPLTFDRWTASVRALSDQFGRPIADVAEGTYQTLSNQVAKGTDAINFMTEALKFSQVTISTTAQSVNLLSGALNAFHLSADQTDRVASVLFKTIQLGRVRAEEMSETFGRVGVLASRLGVTIEETAAATSTLTIQGVKFADASTQLTNILVKLLHPTEEMKKLFEEWGVSSGPAAISTFGFIGVVKKLEEAAKGSSKELADLFNEIKGTRGILGLTGDAFDTFNENLKKITASSSSYIEAQKIIRENVGQKFTEELTRAKNYFVDFGLDFVKVFTTVTTSTGHFADGLKNLIQVGTIAAETFVIYKTAMFAWNLQAVVATRNVLALATGIRALAAAESVAETVSYGGGAAAAGGIAAFLFSPAALALGVVALHQYVVQQQAEVDHFYLEAEAKALIAAGEISKKQNDILEQQSAEIVRQYDLRTRVYFEHLAKVNQLSTRAAELEAKALQDASRLVKESLEYDLKQLEHQISEVSRTVEAADSNIKRLQESLFENQEELNKTLYERHLKLLAPNDQIKTELEHLNKLEKDSVALLNQKNNTNPLITKENIAKSDKLSRESALELSNLEEKRATLLEKQKTEKDKLVELSKREAALVEKIGTQGDLRNLSNQQRQIRERKLKDKSSVGNIEGIAGLRNLAGEDTEAEQLRRLQEERTQIQNTLNGYNQQLNLLPTLAQFDQKRLEISKEQEVVKTRLIELEKTEKKIAEEQKKELEQQAIILRKTIEEIAAFPGKKAPVIQSEKDKATRLGAFDETVQRAVNTGLTDQSTFLQIGQLRAKIEEDANRQILENDKKTIEERIRLGKNLLKVKQEQLTEGLAKSNTQANESQARLTTIFQDLRNRQPAPVQGISPVNIGEIDDAVKTFKGTPNQSVATSNLQATFKAALDAAKSGGGLTDVTTSKEQADAIQKDFNDALDKYVKAVSLQTDLTKQQAALAKPVGVTPAALITVQDELLKYNQDYSKQIFQITGQLQSLDTTLSQIQARFQALLQGNVSPQTPVKATPSSGPGPQSSAVGGNFPITINYYGTGNIPIDVLAIGKGLQQALRLGTLSPFT